ncbi:MAG: hypothetical protein V4692_16445 [Bdellovibrionota bacterium]
MRKSSIALFVFLISTFAAQANASSMRISCDRALTGAKGQMLPSAEPRWAYDAKKIGFTDGILQMTTEDDLVIQITDAECAILTSSNSMLTQAQ